MLQGDLGDLIIEANARAEHSKDLSVVLRNIPLDLFALMQVYQDALPERLKSCLPKLPPQSEQLAWAGNSGLPLMLQTSDYVKLITSMYLRCRSKPLSEIRFLDYGCGWGRVIRFMATLVRNENIFGVDPMQGSLDICQRDGVPGNITTCELLPTETVEPEVKFDLINCFSVFTHLSASAHTIVLAALRNLVADDGLLFLSIRSRRYWEQVQSQSGPVVTAQQLADHELRGFSFLAGHRESNLGKNYGDASISLDYVRQHWTGWNLDAVEFSHHQPNQLFLCLSPRL